MNHVPPAEMVSKLREEDDFLIVGHVDADPDSIGSILGLRRILIALQKKCIAVTPTALPPMLEFLPDAETLLIPSEVPSGSWRSMIVVDCGVERTGDVADWARNASSVINIDHHATNSGTGTHNWVDASFAATTQMIAVLRESIGVDLDSVLATLLYAGLVGDTGSFRFSNTTPEVLRLAADLHEAGVDAQSINSNLYERHSFEYVRLLALVLQSAQSACSGRVVHAEVTAAMRKSVGAPADEGEGIIQYLRLIRNIDVCVLFTETDADYIRVQLRSSPFVDVAAIARSLGGGGHERAAGVKLTGTLDEVRERVIAQIGEALQPLPG